MTLHIGTQTQKLLSNFPKTCHVTSSWADAVASSDELVMVSDFDPC